MKKTVSQLLSEIDSAYVPVGKDGKNVIRVSGHPPDPVRIKEGKYTKNCENIYLIFVKSLIDTAWQDDAELEKLIRLIESSDAKERARGKADLNNWMVEIGDEAKKGMCYQIIDGNCRRDIDTAVENAAKMLKTSVFVPLKHIVTADEACKPL